MYLSFASMSTVFRIERRVERNGGVLRGIRMPLKKRRLLQYYVEVIGGAQNWTTYTDDDTGF